MNISESTMEQLKAAAYDTMAQMETAQRNLRIINEEIMKRQVELKDTKEQDAV